MRHTWRRLHTLAVSTGWTRRSLYREARPMAGLLFGQTCRLPQSRLLESMWTPGPIVDEMAIFRMYFPFAEAGLARISSP